MELFFFLGVLALILFVTFTIIIVGIYNALLAVKENVQKAWANIDVILKQRYDEIPQLIKICEQYVDYEDAMITKVMEAREKMISGKTVHDKADGFNKLTTGVSGLMAIGERYPNLKANQHFKQIQIRLSTLEETLADRREFYNESVNVYNIRIQQIPDVLFAHLLNFNRMQMFEIIDEEKAHPDLITKLKVS